MSAQTGVEPPRGPASQRIGDRVAYRVALWRSQPNPILMREMRQAARLLRTPIILMVITVLVTLLMASMGGIMTGDRSPAEAGSILFHTYFSLAFFVVALVGPALAANSIASEREGKTWEALLLTGMRPEEVTRGKFMSAYAGIATYIVMLSPVGALPFLFGGVTPFEVLVAFVFLFLLALLTVAFGLAVSAKMASLRSALLVTLLVAAPLSVFAFSSFGLALSLAAHELWEAVEQGAPVWLPTAYGRAPFGLEYVVYLVVLPIASIALPAWLLYEITRSNLTSVTDDRSHGLKRWYLCAAPCIAAAATVPMFGVRAGDRGDAMIAGMCFFFVFVVFNVFLFSGEAIGPSRRVKLALQGSSWIRRALSPGVTRTAQLQIAVTLAMFAALMLTAYLFIDPASSASASEHVEQVALIAAYAVGFSLFIIGLAALLRARSTSTTVPRVLLLVVLFFVCTGPWIIAAITGVMSSSSTRFGGELAVAAPSPFYVFVAIDAVGRPDPGVAIAASVMASIAYAGIGATLLGFAHVTARRIVHDHEAMLADADRRLAEEDEQAAAARAQAEEAQAAAEEPAPTTLPVGPEVTGHTSD